MGNTMLGPHINWKSDQIEWLAKAKPRVAKVLIQNVDESWLSEACAASPDTFWVGRLVVVPQDLDEPQADAEDFCQRLLLPAAEPFQGLLDALEGYNEISFTQFKTPTSSLLGRLRSHSVRSDLLSVARQEMQRYALFEQTRCRILAEEGWKSVVGNFSTGTPELELWPDFYPALQAGDYLGLHEYSANTHPPYMKNLDTWLCRRYRRVYEQLPEHLYLPLIITECGIDGGVLGQVQAGWKRYTDVPGYLSELEWYDESLQADSERWPIVGATIYCYGHVDPHWSTFDIQGEMAEELADYMQANPALPWQEPEQPPSEDPLVSQLEAEFGAQFDDIRSELVQTGEYEHRDLARIDYQVIHHTGPGTTAQTYSNTIARYHVESNGWPAIGYHFLVYSHIVRYVGSLDTARANVWGRNPEVIGIAIVGNYQEDWPDEDALILCRRLCDALDQYLGRQVPRVSHKEVALPGHDTQCPGETAFGPDGWLEIIQREEETPPDDEVARLRARIRELESELASCHAEREAFAEALGRVQSHLEESLQIIEGT